jgi:hypothetical protein
MKKIAVLALVSVVGAAQAQTLFYGGDVDLTNGGNGIISQVGGTYTDFWVYDDFTLSDGSSITSVFGNFGDTSTTPGVGLHWEIRTGVAAGSGGTVVASGVSTNFTRVATGRAPLGLTEYTYTAAVSGVNLAAGTYFLGIALDNSNSTDARSYLSITSGANGIGSPIHNGNSFVNSPSQGLDWTDTQDLVGEPTDFSLGLTGTTVPEPASMAALGLGALALIRRRRASK